MAATSFNARVDHGPFAGKALITASILAGLLLLVFVVVASIDPEWAKAKSNRANAFSDSAVGYSAFAQLTKDLDYMVSDGRETDVAPYGSLLILTPDEGVVGSEVADAVLAYHQLGPSLIILPSWRVSAQQFRKEWVRRLPANIRPINIDPFVAELGLNGDKEPRRAMAAINSDISPPPTERRLALYNINADPIITDGKNGTFLAAFEAISDTKLMHPAYIVSDAELFNNVGMADRKNAQFAIKLLDLILEDSDASIIHFDGKLYGIAPSSSIFATLLRPPLVGLTLLALVGLMLIVWQAFMHKGAAQAEPRALPHGKQSLIENMAVLLMRTRHAPRSAARYAALVRRQILSALSAPAALSNDAADAWIDARLPPGSPSFAQAAERLSQASSDHERIAAGRTIFAIRKDLLREH